MASSQTECDVVEDIIHLRSPALIVKVILERSDNCYEIAAIEDPIVQDLKFLKGHLRPEQIDHSEKPIDHTVSLRWYFLMF